MATLEEVQDEVIVDIKDMFRELVTKAFEKPKISLEDDITDASADAAVESAASAAANEGADADDGMWCGEAIVLLLLGVRRSSLGLRFFLLFPATLFFPFLPCLCVTCDN